MPASRRKQAKKTAPAPLQINWKGHVGLEGLSEELLDRIVHQFSLLAPKRSDLLALVRVRPFSQAARRHLFRRLAYDLVDGTRNETVLEAIDLNHASQDIRRISLRRAAFAASHGERSDLERAIGLLSRAPALTDLEIRTRMRHSAADQAPAQLVDELAHAFSEMKVLQRLILTPPLAETIDDLTDGRTPTRLSLDQPYLIGLSSFAKLTVLDLWEVSVPNALAAARPTFRLHRLAMMRVDLSAEALTWLLDSTSRSASLQELELNAVTATEATAEAGQAFDEALRSVLKAVLPTLRLLALSALGSILSGEGAVDVLRNARALQRLSLSLIVLEPAAFVAIAAPIRVLELDLIRSLEPSLITTAVARLRSTLKRVTLVTSNDQPLVEAWEWPRATRRSLRAVCNLHGITLEIDGLLLPDDVELSSADENPADPTSVANPPSEEEREEEDDLFVLDDERRARYEEEVGNDIALLEEARQKGDDASEDEFMMAPTSEEDDV